MGVINESVKVPRGSTLNLLSEANAGKRIAFAERSIVGGLKGGRGDGYCIAKQRGWFEKVSGRVQKGGKGG